MGFLLMVAGLAGVVTLSAPLAWAEKVEMVTFFPSPTAATETPPTPPYTVYIPVARWLVNPGAPFNQLYWNASTGGLDVHQALGLWRAGVTRDQVTMTDWNGCGGPCGGCVKNCVAWDGFGSFAISYSSPSFYQGFVETPSGSWKADRGSSTSVQQAPAVYQVTVTWPTS